MNLALLVKTRAQELGFVGCGITHPGPSAYGEQLDEWLAKGYAGTMRYLHRQASRRRNPGLIAREARSVVVVLDNYYTPRSGRGPESPEGREVCKGKRLSPGHQPTAR